MWEPSDAALRCGECRTHFGLFVRKHHCRVCGRVFCDSCTYNRVRIPSVMDACVVQSPTAGMLTTAMRWVQGNPDSPKTQRVCSACHTNIVNVRRSKSIIDAILLVDEVTIEDWRTLRVLSRKFRIAIDTLLNTWKTTGYLPPYKEPSSSQKRLMLANRRLLSGHVAWLGRGFADSIHCHTSCGTLECRTACREVPVQIKRVVDMFLSSAIRTLPSTAHLEDMTNCIASRAVRDPEVFRSIVIPIICSGDTIAGQRLFFQINGRNPALGGKLMQIAPTEVVLRWRKTLLWVEAMKNVAEWEEALHVEPAAWEGATLPSQPDVRILDILSDAVTMKRSSSNPVVIPCVCENARGKRFVQCYLMKQESVLADCAVEELCSMIKFLSSIEDKVAMLITYDVLPLSPTSGMITVVPGCVTLGRLRAEGQSITNYILENNNDESVQALKSRFLGSCAATSVISTIMCVGDRHLDNLLLTRKGELFGVDFAYLCGAEPLGKEFLGSSLRLTPQIIEFLGGVGSVHYNMFKSVAGDVFNLCRRYLPILYVIMRSLVYDEITTDYALREQIESAWMPSGTDITCKILIENRIERVSRGHGGWRDALADTLHGWFT